MKYGQQFASTLSGTSDEVQKASINYRELKKSIKRVQNELNSLGLDAEVLKELLEAGSTNGNTAETADVTADGALISPSSSRPASLRKSVYSQAKTSPRRRKPRQQRAHAEYELAGTVDNPIPRIKLVFLSDSSETETSTADDEKHRDLYNRIALADSAQIVKLDEVSDEDDEEEDRATLRALSRPGSLRGYGTTPPSPDQLERKALLDKLYGLNISPASKVTPPGSPVLPADNTAPINGSHAEIARKAEDGLALLGPAYIMDKEKGESSTDTGDEADIDIRDNDFRESERNAKCRTTKHRQKRRRKEVIINLEYDSEFFILLNQALQSLSSLMTSEKRAFTLAVRELARMVSAASSSSKSKDNLYAWREVFSLWVEAQIFEGATERTRGERSIEEVEKRLDWFVDQVGRRKLAKQMKSKESRAALEQFVHLNQQLLQLKRIGYANREAARKILKKHDKRLGLSASSDFPDFVQKQRIQQEAQGSTGAMTASRTAIASRISSEEMTSLVFAGITTLPHVLLSTITEILLPVIPSIDDYSCLICGEIAWRPITLDCKHMFCIRCLVKMQRRGQDACPSCRAPVVMKANKDNLNAALVAFEKRWFPREVKMREKANLKEIESEYAEDMNLNSKCILM